MTTFTLGNHTFRPADQLDAVFGATASDYPRQKDIPQEYMRGNTPGCKLFSELFFSGGRLSDFGFQIKEGVDQGMFYHTLRALMTSFAPQHEIKKATCGWFIDTYCTKIKG